jgi:cytochrome c
MHAETLRPLALGAAACFAAMVAATAVAFGADAERGKEVWFDNCFGCHALEADRVGPRHKGVVGRRAGSVPGFDYSPALRAAGFTWTEELIQRWLAGPPRLVPGTKMGFSLGSAADRADVAAYLARESGR